MWIVDSPDTVRTDSVGRFVMPAMPAGTYTLLASDTLLVKAGVSRTGPTHLLIGEGQNVDVSVQFHSRADVLEQMCKGQHYTLGQGVMLGQVTDSTSSPRPNARIELWRRIQSRNTELFREEVSGEAGDDGRFIICGLPRDQLLRVRATQVDDTAETLVDARKEEVSLVTLRLKRKP